MKSLLATILASLLVACSGGNESPGNTLHSLDIADYKGRWVVVNYWAKWCKPCIKEIPELNALDRKYPQVAVLGVNYDGASGEALQAQIDDLDIQFPIILAEPSSTLGVELPSVLPTTLILNPDGKLVATLVGPQDLESLALATGQVGMPETETGTPEVLDTELQ